MHTKGERVYKRRGHETNTNTDGQKTKNKPDKGMREKIKTYRRSKWGRGRRKEMIHRLGD